MLPVAYMIPKSESENAVSKIVAVKEEPEGINYTIVFFNNHKNRRRRTSAPDTWCLDGFARSTLVRRWK
jgi:hypothetical protein